MCKMWETYQELCCHACIFNQSIFHQERVFKVCGLIGLTRAHCDIIQSTHSSECDVDRRYALGLQLVQTCLGVMPFRREKRRKLAGSFLLPYLSMLQWLAASCHLQYIKYTTQVSLVRTSDPGVVSHRENHSRFLLSFAVTLIVARIAEWLDTFGSVTSGVCGTQP